MINLDKIQSMWQEDCKIDIDNMHEESINCLLYTSPSPRDRQKSRIAACG